MVPAKARATVKGDGGRGRGRFIIARREGSRGEINALLSSNSETRGEQQYRSHVSGFGNGPSRFAASYLNKALCRAGPSPLPKYVYSHACMPKCRITVSLSCSFCGFPPFLGNRADACRSARNLAPTAIRGGHSWKAWNVNFKIRVVKYKYFPKIIPSVLDENSSWFNYLNFNAT